MSESNGRCESGHPGYCCPPKYITDSGFRCPKAIPIQSGDITEKCGATDADLLTEEEWDELADRKYDKMVDSVDMWEMKGYRRK